MRRGMAVCQNLEQETNNHVNIYNRFERSDDRFRYRGAYCCPLLAG
jgi:hypothetical protein